MAPDGSQPARCNPWDADGLTCCSSDGRCVSSSGCSSSCADCVDYRIRRTWRDDGRCGADVRNAEGLRPSQCHPMHPQNLTCCSEEGFCGAWPSYAHCRCKDCVNYHTACTCTAPSSPCQDPASGRCYPRTKTPSNEQEQREEQRLARRKAAEQDRPPDMDPRRSMRSVAIDTQFEIRADGKASAEGPGQQPIVDGVQCAAGLVDCVGHGMQESSATPPELESEAKVAGAADAADASELTSSVSVGDSSTNDETPPPPSITSPPASPPPLPIRLAAGARPHEGRLELLFNGTWGSVCGKGWGWTAAHVACRSMGYGGVESVSTSSEFGRSLGPVWLSNVDCEGTEPRLERCRYYGLGESTVPPSCVQHQLDVGVQCTRQPLPVPQRVPSADQQVSRATGQRAARIGAGGDANSTPHCDARTSSSSQPVDLASALDGLEEVLVDLEDRRLIVQETHLARLTRLRLRLRRLAGKPDDSSAAETTCACPSGSLSPSLTTTDASARPAGEGGEHADAAAADVPQGLAGRLSAEMLEELRRMPRRSDEKPLHESRAEFEERQRLERFDPLENDPAEQARRRRSEQYEAPGSRPPPLMEAKPHERLRKPPIQTLTNRKAPHWKEAYDARYEHTMEQIRLGLAPEGIERTLGPGPWDHDPSFWRDPHERDVVLDHEFDEDIVFDT